ncbi:MAG: DUF896 domain-containing protein [Ruminococcaceae bacterium]|nr:DUF896 domain-containing protein [Oscillospiraceae bacterium]
MEQAKLDRINALARKKKAEGLTPDEILEQRALREEYILEFRAGLRGILDNTYIEYPDGTRVKVEQKKQP